MSARIENVDCLIGLQSLQNNSVDCVITSPPYNFNVEYGVYSDNKEIGEYLDWLKEIFTEIFRVLKDDARVIINIQPIWSEHVPTHHLLSDILRDIRYIWAHEIVWDKHNYNCAYTAWGSYMSPSAPYLKYRWEYIEVFFKKQSKKIGKKEDIDIAKQEFIKYVDAMWEFAPERNQKLYEHPAMFPEELPYRCMKLFTYKHDVILDPFMGCGTTGAVAVRLNRDFIGFEIDEKYFNTAKKRIEQVQKKINTKLF